MKWAAGSRLAGCTFGLPSRLAAAVEAGSDMPIFQIILVFVVIGVILWLINSFVPMDANIKKLMNVAVIVLMVIWLISLLFPSLWNIRVGHY